MKKFILMFIIITVCPTRLLYSRYIDGKVNIEAYAFVGPKINVINHIPYEKICILGDKLIIQGDVTGAKELYLYYKKRNVTNYNKLIKIFPSENKAEFAFEISPNEVTLNGIDYYLKATNITYNYCFYKYSKDSPYNLEVCQQNSKVIGVSGGKLELIDGNPYDGETCIDIPEDALKKNTDILIQQIDINSVPEGKGLAQRDKPLAAFNFAPDKTVFNKPATISLLYFDLNNDGIVELMDGSKTEVEESRLGIFWWDGYEWRYIGGSVDKKLNTVRAKITHFSLYALFPVGKITPEALRPRERIITPNGDGINDYAHFGGTPGDYTIKILDIAGREIKTIKDILVWDGKDNNGNYVESGAYIYQFKVILDEVPKIISGVIVIAK